ncbi:phosphatase PAP2 family protein [Clostridium beijerinckii]|jgi:Membrane-associated phospholipid phosphatase|uniref:Phosphatase PAP2 family protein n=2 Tax=Clostridium beijerinckii TaxID=1520 RepID=A0AAE2UXD8_CLOBE|nr:phosphatase PAP2 family protein [Clostridium beijerinckii]ABR34499.1 phosphoesterase, PA-phosphatase related [Clostridium beijerinckii NCIMB 8052]AIU03104.1 phosphoesterase, PA-phosphatase related protein [Clostridium beijerinckii ATCC 35702]MBF7810879.1 phosphatase PAP2 family protein [Clostridium beijerinckii]NRT24166.1 undecaprenyl-diphosphatase [Clostridium beijerinckii]NRT68248.1 undecaprenyl-diphosphatase [Clostridium beijerinckii]
MEVIQNIDNNILEFIQIHMRTPVLDKVMPLITILGSKITIWTFIALILIIGKEYRKYGIMIICSLILCFIVGNLGLKPLVARTRPFNAEPILNMIHMKLPTDFSFPSGHTMCSFAPATIINYMNKRAGILALTLSTLIGFSRLYLYVHYPSDVFAAMVIGLLIGNLVIAAFNKRALSSILS